MTKDHSTPLEKSEPVALCDQLHRIAARLAGLEDVLRRVYDDCGAEAGNILHLMADVAAETNHQLCLVADRVSDMQQGAQP